MHFDVVGLKDARESSEDAYVFLNLANDQQEAEANTKIRFGFCTSTQTRVGLGETTWERMRQSIEP